MQQAERVVGNKSAPENGGGAEGGRMKEMMLAVITVIVAFGSAWAQGVMPRKPTLQRETEVEKEVLVDTYASWRPDCTSREPPQIVVRTQPIHGTVSVRPGRTTIPRAGEGDSLMCQAGIVISGTAVWYLPMPGFHGLDGFDYDVMGTQLAHEMVTVNVR